MTTPHETHPPRFVQLGEVFSSTYQLTPENVRRFANAAEDHNPLHHDSLYAMDTRFGGLIASGTQIVSLFMGLTATHYSEARLQPLGLEFDVKLRKAAMAHDLIALRWVVTDAYFKESLEGDIVTLEGTVKNEGGDTLVAGTSKLLVMERV
ncbi:MAG: MaoC family dehydratase [Pararobbsia sp.]